MGYPMTFQRVVNRNGLRDGDYGEPPQNWRRAIPTPRRVPLGKLEPGVDKLEVLHQHAERLIDDLERAEGQVSMLAGDLRRLERDAVDENAVCGYIASRTGVDREIVAAVLKEFMSW